MIKNIRASWAKFQNIVMGLLTIIGLNTFISSYHDLYLKITVDVIAVVMLLVYCSFAESNPNSATKASTKNNKETKVDKIETEKPASTSGSGFNLLDKLGFYDEEMDRPFIYCSFKNNKNKEIVKNSLIMEDFSPQEALYYMSIIKAETCGEAIDECIRLKKIDDNKSQEAPSIEELLKDDTEYCDNDDELQITEDLIDFLITYKKYSRKDAESIADITPGTTLGERIANATKPRKRKNQ